MLEIVGFIFGWLFVGTLIYAAYQALMNHDLDKETTDEVIFGAVFWPVMIAAPVAAMVYVAISSVRKRLTDRFAGR